MGVECGLVGAKLAHSYSQKIHAMLGDYDYRLVECDRDGLDRLLRSRDFRGLNVTIPYKADALSYCDALSPESKRLSNVNTIVMENGRLDGYNTDFDGFCAMVERSRIDVTGKKCAVLGGRGGSGQTARAALSSMGAREVLSVSRGGPVTYESLVREHADVDVIVNATPVGMYPNAGASPVSLDDFPNCAGVLDLIYNPNRTALLCQARERGIKHQNGLWMLVAQARRASELFTGVSIHDERVEAIHRALLHDTQNAVLIGMPGCGKTSVGQLLAKRMGREFVDIDEEIVRCAGTDIPTIFATRGEAAFREIESEVIGRVSQRSSLVIATGGGAVLKRGNVQKLEQNGLLIFIDRPIDELSTHGRPLYHGYDALLRMAEERLPLYKKYGRIRVSNVATLEHATAAAQEGFYEAACD